MNQETDVLPRVRAWLLTDVEYGNAFDITTWVHGADDETLRRIVSGDRGPSLAGRGPITFVRLNSRGLEGWDTALPPLDDMNAYVELSTCELATYIRFHRPQLRDCLRFCACRAILTAAAIRFCLCDAVVFPAGHICGNCEDQFHRFAP